MVYATLFIAAGNTSREATSDALFGFFSSTLRKSLQENPRTTIANNINKIYFFISKYF